MHKIVKDYYGKQLQNSDDLKTSACCDASQVPDWLKPLLARIHPEVMSRYYGCGLVCPPLLEGCRVLDLGSGSGRDVYALAQLAGGRGQVVGVDMTEEQLAVAESYRAYHARHSVLTTSCSSRATSRNSMNSGWKAAASMSSCRTAWSICRRTRMRCCAKCIACSSRAANSISPMSMPTGACRMRCATIRCCTANAWAARCTGTTFCGLPQRHGFADPRLVD